MKNKIPVFLIYFLIFGGTLALFFAADILTEEMSPLLLLYPVVLLALLIMYFALRKKLTDKFGVSYTAGGAMALIALVISEILGALFVTYIDKHVDMFFPPIGDSWHDAWRGAGLYFILFESLGGAAVMAFAIILDIIIRKIIKDRKKAKNEK